MSSFQFASSVRGYHVYKDVWTPTIGDVLPCSRELSNGHDPYAVKVTLSTEVVGHLPKRINSICSTFLRRSGSIMCTVTGSRRYSGDLIQGGLEIPCILIFEADDCLIEKVKKLLLFVDKLSDTAPAKPADPKPIDADPTPKRIKIEEEDSSSGQECETVWLVQSSCNIRLSLADKGFIEDGKKLNDNHINFAQALLAS